MRKRCDSGRSQESSSMPAELKMGAVTVSVAKLTFKAYHIVNAAFNLRVCKQLRLYLSV